MLPLVALLTSPSRAAVACCFRTLLGLGHAPVWYPQCVMVTEPFRGSAAGLLADVAFVFFLCLLLSSVDGLLTHFTSQSSHRWYLMAALAVLVCQWPVGVRLSVFSISSPSGVFVWMHIVHCILIVGTTVANGLTEDAWAVRTIREHMLALVLSFVSVFGGSGFASRRSPVRLLLLLARVLGCHNGFALVSPWLNHRFGFQAVTGRLHTVTTNPNTTGGLAAFGGAAALVLLLQGARWELVCYFVLSVSVSALSGSRGAIAALLVLAVLMSRRAVLQARRRWRLPFLLVALGLTILTIAAVYRLLAVSAQVLLLRRWTWFFSLGPGLKVDPTVRRVLSTRQRVFLARHALKVGLAARGLGAGAGAARYMTDYGWTDNGWPLSSHNTYLELFAEQGVLAVLALLWFQLSLVRASSRSYGTPFPLLVAGQLGVWCMVFGSGTTYPPGLVALLGTVGVLAQRSPSFSSRVTGGS